MRLEFPRLQQTCIDTPLGRLRLTAHPGALTRIDFADDTTAGLSDPPSPVLVQAINELEAYFSGACRQFAVPCDPLGTHFQLNVWEELVRISYAKTITYQDLARKLGDVKVTRASAGAVARNPIPIIIPCHRVVGKNGSLTGYSGGLARKKWLLQHESQPDQNQLF